MDTSICLLSQGSNLVVMMREESIQSIEQCDIRYSEIILCDRLLFDIVRP